ncbi:MAG: hypothetical protein ACTHWO_10700 [Nesterenkonia sp.]
MIAVNDFEARFSRAAEYPYEIPSTGFAVDVTTGETQPIVCELIQSELVGREPILAIGSNAAPSQLIRKFRSQATESTIYTTNVNVLDHDVTFARLLAPYGAVPATMIPSPGTTVRAKVNWLTRSQMELMHETEGIGSVYTLESLDGQYLGTEGEEAPCGCGRDSLPYYRASTGPLYLGASPVALASIQAENRLFPGLSELSLLSTILSEKGSTPREFLHEILGDSRTFDQALAWIQTRYTLGDTHG